MKSVIFNINPRKSYSFQTSPSGRCLPCTVKEFLKSPFAKEELISIDEGIGPDSMPVWSTYDGWHAERYVSLVRDFILFIDKTQIVNNEFLAVCIRDQRSVLEAVSIWFEGSELSVEVSHHAQGETGLLDISIEGIGSIRRVVLPIDIQERDMFNVYYDENSKGGGVWSKDLVNTLSDFVQAEAA